LTQARHGSADCGTLASVISGDDSTFAFFDDNLNCLKKKEETKKKRQQKLRR